MTYEGLLAVLEVGILGVVALRHHRKAQRHVRKHGPDWMHEGD